MPCRAERIRSRLQELESEFTPIKARAAPAVTHTREDDDDDDGGLSDGDTPLQRQCWFCCVPLGTPSVLVT